MNRESIFLEVHLINLKQRRTDRYRFAGTENCYTEKNCAQRTLLILQYLIDA